MEAPNGILVLRGGALGDFILTLPVFTVLRNRWPRTRIGCMGYPRATALAAGAGLIDEAFSLDALDAARLFALDACLSYDWRKRFKRYDTGLSFLHDPDEVIRRNLIRAGIRRVIVHSPLVEAGHAVDHFLKPLAVMGFDVPEGSSPRLALPERPVDKTRDETHFSGDGVVFLHPGSGSRKKNWPLEKFAALSRALSELGIKTAFLAGEAETGCVEMLKHEAPGTPVVSEPDLGRLAYLLSAARAYVGNDSGVTHLAAAVGIPVVALFGPTDAAVWGPRGTNVNVVRATEPTSEGLARVEVNTVLQVVRIGLSSKSG